MRIFRLSIVLALLFLITLVSSRGGGGCFLPGTQVETLYGEINIENALPGETVLAFDENGVATANILDIYEVERDYYYSIITNESSVNVTAEHPFYVGNSQFKEAQKLEAGDVIYVLKEGKLMPGTVIGTVRVDAPTKAYNLQVDNAHTFFANDFAVHNKGGCFLPGTLVQTSKGEKTIEKLVAGDEVLALNDNGDDEGSIESTTVLETYQVTRDYYYTIKTSTSEVNATAEHPFYTSEGYKEVKDLVAGDELFIYKNGFLSKERILFISLIPEKTIAYNLQVGGPHAFFANGFAVHNKGGGGGGHGGRSSGPPPNVFYYDCKRTSNESGVEKACCAKISSKHVSTFSASGTSIATYEYPYCTCQMHDVKNGSIMSGSNVLFYPNTAQCACTNAPDSGYPIKSDQICPLSPVEALASLLSEGLCPILVWLVIIALAFFGGKYKRHGSEWSSTVAVQKDKLMTKAKRTSALLEIWGRANELWDESAIKETAKNTFLKLQASWEKRDYTEMQPLMAKPLYDEHVAQLEAMEARHEINKLESLKLLETQIVLVKNYYKDGQDEFTAWLQAQARDIIVDDRTGNKIRGDVGIGTFEEFWTFRREDNQWKLIKITQPEEGMSVLNQENFDAISTEGMVERTEDKAGGRKTKDLKVAAVREQEEQAADAAIGTIKWKSGRVHRMLNFLVEYDKIWKEDEMLGMVRSLFIMLNTSIEKKNLDNVKDKLTPELFATVEKNISELQAKGFTVQKRNLALRDVEIVLVKNFYDNRKDEFTVWISGQAQEVVVDKKEKIVQGDNYVADFEEFWTFQRQDKLWLLKSIEKGFKAKDFIQQENIDEGTSKEMLEWYYTKDRA